MLNPNAQQPISDQPIQIDAVRELNNNSKLVPPLDSAGQMELLQNTYLRKSLPGSSIGLGNSSNS